MSTSISRITRKLTNRAESIVTNYCHREKFPTSQRCLYCQLCQLNNNEQQLSSTLPDARGLPIIGTLTSIVRSRGGARLHDYVDVLHKKYGSLFRGRIGPVVAVFVSDPDAIRKVYSLEGVTPGSIVPEAWLLYNERRQRARGLLFMNGDEWLTNRRAMNKIMLTSSSTELMIEPCYVAATCLVNNWRRYANGVTIIPNLENQLYQFSIEVILATLIGGRTWPYYRERIVDDLRSLSRNLALIFEQSVKLSRLRARLAEALNLPAWRDFVATTDYCFETVDRLVDNIESMRHDACDGMFARMAAAKGLDGRMLRRIVVDLIVAAGDTTAFALQWLLYLLACNQKVQEKLYVTVRELDNDQVLQEPLVRGTIKETLRLYPIAPFIGRIMPQTDYLDRYLIERGELVAMSLYTSGRTESHFPGADEFRPERWLRNDKGVYAAVNNPNASLPFSMGARSCMGKKLAEIQLSLVTVELLKNFKIDCVNKDRISIKLRLITAPSEPLQLRLTARK